MTKIKKRNELSIFEELRLKPEDFRETPKIEDLVEIDHVYYYYRPLQSSLELEKSHWRRSICSRDAYDPN